MLVIINIYSAKQQSNNNTNHVYLLWAKHNFRLLMQFHLPGTSQALWRFYFMFSLEKIQMSKKGSEAFHKTQNMSNHIASTEKSCFNSNTATWYQCIFSSKHLQCLALLCILHMSPLDLTGVVCCYSSYISILQLKIQKINKIQHLNSLAFEKGFNGSLLSI